MWPNLQFLEVWFWSHFVVLLKSDLDVQQTHFSGGSTINHKFKTGNPYRRGRLGTVDLLVLTSLDELIYEWKYYFPLLQNKLSSVKIQLLTPDAYSIANLSRLELACFIIYTHHLFLIKRTSLHEGEVLSWWVILTWLRMIYKLFLCWHNVETCI